MADSKMADCQLIGMTNDELNLFIGEGKVPSGWNPLEFRITHGLLSQIFLSLESFGRPQSDIVEICSTLLDVNVDMVAKIIKKPSNLKRSIFNSLAKDKNNFSNIYAPFYETLDEGKSSNCNFLKSRGLDLKFLDSICKGNVVLPDGFQKSPLTNQEILFLLDAKMKLNASWINLKDWVCLFCCDDNETIFEESLRTAVLKVKERVTDLRKHQKMPDVEIFLNDLFIKPINRYEKRKHELVSGVSDPQHIDVIEKTKMIKILLNRLDESEGRIRWLIDRLNEEKEGKRIAEGDAQIFKDECNVAINDLKAKEEELKVLVEKIGALNAKNVNRKIKRLRTKYDELEEENEEMLVDLSTELLERDEELAEKNQEINELVGNLDKAMHEKLCAQRMKSHYKTELKKKSVDNSSKIFNSKIDDLKERITELENEKLEIEERLNVFLKGDEICFFENGKYVDEIRMLYEDLLCLGVSTNNVENVIRKCLKVVGVNVHNLPKATFAKYMLYEARSLAQLHVFDELRENWNTENRTLHSDGTSKKGRSFITYDIVKDDGECLITGLREIASGDSATQLKVLQDVLGDVCLMFENSGLVGEGGVNDWVNKIIKSIKNVMSDRCAVQKKFNELFTCFRKDVLPSVVEGWESLTNVEKEKLSGVNEFFCGLHYLVALADQAEACCKIWDTLCWEDKKVGSLAHGGYSKGESGAHRLIKTVCKSVQERGCEKSGRMIHFKTFLEQERNVHEIPLAPFFGNRFNILFHNAAGTYYLEEHLKIFFERYGKDNKLLSAVKHDLDVTSFLTACRALGMIDKLITGPLWRAISKDGHILDMNVFYQRLYDKFMLWGSDASEFMTGDVKLFGDDILINKDCIYEYLYLAKGEEHEQMTKQCLEIIFSGFAVVTKRLLEDHMEGGKFWNKDQDQAFRKETKNVEKSNVKSERDFGMLDYQMKLKPKATDFAIEGIIMFKANKTGDWREKLTNEKRKKFLEIARKSKKMQREKYLSTKQQVATQRAQNMSEKLKIKEQKEREQRILKETLHSKIEKFGLWKTKEEVISGMGKIAGIGKKREALWLQIRFRNKVLGNKHSDKSVFQLTTKGVSNSPEILIKNLLTIIEETEKDKELLTERDQISGTDTSKVFILEKSKFLEEKDKLLKKASEGPRDSSKGKKKQPKKKQPKKKTPSRKEINLHARTPVISCAEDLIGKRVCQRFVDCDGERWYNGTVVNGGIGRNPMFTILYDDDPNLYKYKLMEDFEIGDLELLTLCTEDLVGKEILHLYSDGDNDECWYKAAVDDVDEESEDIENPDFFVKYSDEMEGDYNDDEEYYLCQLLEDYQNGWVRIVS